MRELQHACLDTLEEMSSSRPERGSYTWDDSDGVISVHIPIGIDISAKDVQVNITSSWMKAGLKGQTPIICGKLFQSIAADDSIWQIERATKTLTIHLEKDAGMPWPILIVSAGPPPADSIDAQSLFFLGEAFEQGRGYSLPADGAQALIHYSKAADLNFVPALVRLAGVYTPKHAPAAALAARAEGVGWAGADSGSVGGALDGVERNAETARQFYTKAAELGNADAQAMLATCLLHPAMLAGAWEPDVPSARQWAEKSAAGGCSEGSYVLGKSYEGSDSQRAVACFAAAGPEHAAALHALGWHHLRGSGGVKADRAQACKLFQQAHKLDGRMPVPSEAEMSQALNNMGGRLFGVPLDLLVVAVGGVVVLGAVFYLRSKAKSNS